MKTRDEIIESVSQMRFSSRNCFYDILDQLTRKQIDSGEIVKLKWPEALNVLTVEDWNRAFDVSMGMAQGMISYRPPAPAIHWDDVQ